METPTTVAEAVLAIQKWDYPLPTIQREFVWTAEKTEALFDSLMRGYVLQTKSFYLEVCWCCGGGAAHASPRQVAGLRWLRRAPESYRGALLSFQKAEVQLLPSLPSLSAGGGLAHQIVSATL